MLPIIIGGIAAVYAGKKIYDWATDDGGSGGGDYDYDDEDDVREQQEYKLKKKQLADARKSLREYVKSLSEIEKISEDNLKVIQLNSEKSMDLIHEDNDFLTKTSKEDLYLINDKGLKSKSIIMYDSKNDASYKKKEIKNLKKEISEIDNLIESELFGITSYFDIKLGGKDDKK